MKQRLLQQVGRSARLRVLNELKRSQGLCVTDLAALLGMSYTGIKELCLDLESRGLLDTWREPQAIGRPRMLYRLTERAHELFPTTSHAMTLAVLAAAQKLFGGTAPEKILLVAFQEKTAEYAARMKSETLAERAQELARLRDHDGYMAQCSAAASGSWQIIEHHSPMRDLLRAYPFIARLETEMFQRLLAAPVQRSETTHSGLFRAVFLIQS